MEQEALSLPVVGMEAQWSCLLSKMLTRKPLSQPEDDLMCPGLSHLPSVPPSSWNMNLNPENRERTENPHQNKQSHTLFFADHLLTFIICQVIYLTGHQQNQGNGEATHLTTSYPTTLLSASVLVNHLKLDEALLIADSYSNSRYPYSKTMGSLIELYGQHHKLALQHITEVPAEPAITSSDSRGFHLFALKARALVGRLDQLENYRQRGNQTVREDSSPIRSLQHALPLSYLDLKPQQRNQSLLHKYGTRQTNQRSPRSIAPSATMFTITLSGAQNSRNLQRSRKWLGSKRVSSAGHLEIIKRHSATSRPNVSCATRLTWKCCMRPIYQQLSDQRGQPPLDPAWRSSCVLLKMVKVCFYNGKRKIDTDAIQDDGSERTILLHSAGEELGLKEQSESLVLRTIRQDTRTVPGMSPSPCPLPLTPRNSSGFTDCSQQ
eukprot:superscaffoldBa00002485_g14435